MLLKKAGARHVYLIRTLKENIREALEEALKMVPKGTLIICESNSARLVAEPACFIMIESSTSSSVKPTAQAVIEYADVILKQTDDSFTDFVQEQLHQRISICF